jgi:hypothetical protein
VDESSSSTASDNSWSYARTFADDCLKNDKACHHFGKTKQLPTRLIDVGEDETTPSNPAFPIRFFWGTQYASLGHCWGANGCPKLTFNVLLLCSNLFSDERCPRRLTT